MPNLRVEWRDLDPGDVVLKDADDAVLTFGADASYGEGWLLYYLEPDGNGVDCTFIGGERDDVGWARESAETRLRRIWPSPP